MPFFLNFLLLISAITLYSCYPHYSSSKVVKSCPSSCKSCSGFFNDICTECYPGYYLTTSGTCDTCDETCLSCSDHHSEACFQCKSELYYLIDGRCQRLQRNLQSTSISLPTSSIELRNGMYLYYTFNNDTAQTMDLYFVFDQECWFGIGYGISMLSVDMIVVEIVNGAIVVTDRWSTAWDTPSLDTSVGGTNDVTLVEYSINSSMIIAHAKRKQNTGDSYDYAMSGPGQYYMMWAFSGSKTIQDHGGNAEYIISKFTPGVQTVAVENTLAMIRTQLLAVHGVLLFLVWGIAAEVMSYLPRYFRWWKYYSQTHAILSWLITILNIVFTIIPIVLDAELNAGYVTGIKVVVAHFAIGVIILILGTIQHFRGIQLILRLKSYSDSEKQYLQRKFHAINGMLVLILAKVELVLGVYWGERNLFPLIIAYIIITVIVRIILEIYFRRTHNSSKKSVELSAKKLTSDQITLLELLSKDISLQSIKSTLPNLKWCLLGNKVVDTTNFTHPGGNYIIQEVWGREIGRFLYGAYALESSKETKPYLHSTRALDLIDDLTIGRIDSSKYSILSSHLQGGINEFEVALMASNSVGMNQPLWSLRKKDDISESVSRFLFSAPQGLVLNYVPGVRWMGKHFVLKFASLQTATRLYTTVLCMTDDNIILRKSLIDYFDEVMNKKIDTGFVSPVGIKDPKAFLPLVIKKYNSPTGFSKPLHELNINNMTSNSFYIEGPVGRGLELTESARGTHVIFVAGTGLLPVLDLLNYLLMKSIFQALIQQKGAALAESTNIFEEKYLKVFDESFNIVLYGSFASEKDMVGYDIVAKLAEINEVYGLKIFKAMIRGVHNPYFKAIERRFDAAILKDINEKEVERVMICGPPQMNQQLITGLREKGFSDDKILMI